MSNDQNALRWVQHGDGSWAGYSGEERVANVAKTGRWELQGVKQRGFRSNGAGPGSEAGKRAAERAWARWIVASAAPSGSTLSHPDEA